MIGPDDRGQAYTLESLIAALVLVTALLFALQSVVILPDSAGLDRDVQAQLHQESSDVLVTAANDGELSQTVRYWHSGDFDGDGNDEWRFADDKNDQNNTYSPGNGYTTDRIPVQDVGEVLNRTVREGNQYNVVLAYTDESGDRETTELVYQGTPGDDVVVASYTVTLTDDQRVTGTNSSTTTLGDAYDNSDGVPIPNQDDTSPVYNVVEVRLVLW